MSNKYEEIKKELEKLVSSVDDFIFGFKNIKNNNMCLLENYEFWYSISKAVVKQLLPDRLEDFVLLYRNDNRKAIKAATVCVSDALRCVDFFYNYDSRLVIPLLLSQQQILKACLETFESKLYNLSNILQAEIFDSEIETAKYLLKNGHLRASGAICGVILETHFGKLSQTHFLKINKKTPTIADYNDAFKDMIYDTIQWRFIQRLGDIRNYCVHNKEREATKEEVHELIDGTDKIVKTVF